MEGYRWMIFLLIVNWQAGIICPESQHHQKHSNSQADPGYQVIAAGKIHGYTEHIGPQGRSNYSPAHGES